MWATLPVEDEPVVTIIDWRIFEVSVSGRKTRHFVGYSTKESEGRVSSAIQNFDINTMKGITNSGRVYQLSGNPYYNKEASYVWDYWKRLNEVEDEKDITDEFARTEKTDSI